MLDAFEEVMRWCFPSYLTDLAAAWFKPLKNGSISMSTDLANIFLRQLRVHISRSKNLMTLSRVKQRFEETLRSYLTRFNAIATIVDKLDPSIILMAVVFGVASKIDFKIALEGDPSMDLLSRGVLS